MKKYILITLSLVFCFTAITAFAKTGLYLGAKGGMFKLDKANALDIFSIGAIAGYNLPFKYKSFEMALESEYNLGYLGGDRVSGGVPGDKTRIRSLGGYGVVRLVNVNGIYTKGKIGVTHEVLLVTESDVETPSREIGPSFGIGFGYKNSEIVNLEIEFATTHSDMKFFSIDFTIAF